MSNVEAEEYKKKGNDFWKEKNYEDAIKQYNKAISLDNTNAAYFSNRSAAWAMKGNADSALADAEKCISADANFVKGYSRKGHALFMQGKTDEAKAAYNAGLAIEPGNGGCKQGLQEVSDAVGRAAASARSAGGGGLLGGLMGGGAGRFMKQVGDRLKKGGRLQMYLVLMVGYYLFNNFSGRNKKTSESSSSSDEPAQYDDEIPGLVREFVDLDGQWVSYMAQRGGGGDATLLMLHGTARSAEADYGATLSKLTASAKTLLAPDRPCHGYSPCREGSDAASTTWLRSLVDKRAASSSLWIVATGAEAAKQALALSRSIPAVSQVWLMGHRTPAPARPSGELGAWLSTQKATGQAAADLARWASSATKETKADTGVLNVAKIPKRVKVSLLYGENEQEDDDLKNALEAQDVNFDVRTGTETESVLDVLVDEVQQLHGGAQSYANEEA